MYDLVAAVSVADRELFGRIRTRDIVCIENGVNVSKFLNASSAVPVKAILALGRLSSNKRLDRLLSFLAALRRRDPQWKLTIAGRPWNVERRRFNVARQDASNPRCSGDSRRPG